MLAAGAEVVVLLADIHGFLDSLKSPIELIESRSQYYRRIITAILESVGVSTEKLEFVFGSSYQKSPEYVMDVYRLSSVISEHDGTNPAAFKTFFWDLKCLVLNLYAARKAGSEVVKQSDNAPLSGLLYPVLQVLDEEHLKVDCQLGGVDQRKLFVAATEWLPKLGYRKVFPLVRIY